MGAGAEAALAVVLRLRNEMQSELGGVRSQLQSFANDAGKVGMALSAGVSLPLIAIGKQAVEVASTFESQMNVLGVAARSSGTAMNDLSKAALLVGSDTQLVGINASQAADAMTNFYKAGMTTSDIFSDLNGYLATGTGLTGALRAAIDLTAASEMDLNQASMLVASSMATYGLSAADATRISNSFVGAADASLASVGDLAQGMANIGPTAAAFGWSIEETNTALAVLSTRGIMGAEAGTALKSMMINLMSPTKDNIAALQGLNVQLYDSEGRMKSLPTIIGALSTAMAGMTDEQRLNTIQTLAGSYGQKAMNTLLAEGVPGWNAMATAVANAATAQEVAAARTQGFKAAMEQLRGAIESVFIQTVTPILQGILTPFIRLLTEAASSVLTLNPALLNAGIAFGAVVAAAGPLLLAIKGIALVVGALTTPIGAVVLAVAALAAAWTGDFLGMRTTITTWWTGIQPQLQAAATNIGTGIGNAVATLRGLWDAHWPGMQATLTTWWGGVKDKFADAYTAIRDKVGTAVKDVSGWWTEHWPKMQKAVTTWWNEVKDKFADAYTAIRDKVGTAVKDVSGWWTEHWPKMQKAVTTWWNEVKDKFADAYTAIRDKVGTAVKDVSGWWTEHWPKMQKAVTTWWNEVKDKFADAYTAIRDKVGTAVKDVSGWWTEHWPKMQKAVTTWWNEVKDKFADAYTAIRDKVGTAVKDVSGWWTEHWPKMQKAVTTWWNEVKDKFADAYTAIRDKVGTAVKDVSGWWTEHWPKMQKAVTTWWNEVKDKFADAYTAIRDKVGTAVKDVSGWWTEHWPKMQKAVTTWWNEVKDKFADAYTAIRDKVGTAVKDVSGWWTEHWPKMQKAVTTWWNEVKDKFADAYTAIRDKVGTAVKDVSGWWTEHWPKMQKAVTTWWNEVKDKFADAYTAIRDKVGTAVKDVSGWWTEHWPKMQKAVTTWWNEVKDKFADAYTAIRDKVGTAVKDVSGWWTEHWPKMQKAVTTWWNEVQPKLSDAVTWIKDKTGGAVKDLSGWFTEHWPKMRTSVETWWTNVKPKLEESTKAVKNLNDGLGDLYKKFSPIDNAAKLLKKNLDPIVEVIGKIIKVVKDVNDLFGAMTKVVNAIKDKVIEYVQFALTPVLGALLAIIQPIKDIVLQIQAKIDKMNAAKEPIDIFTKALQAISGALDAISGAIKGAIDWLGRLAEKIRNLPSPPAWITPGSPTPFELGLRGISDAMGPVVAGLDSLAAAVGGIPKLDAAKDIAEGLASIAEATVKTAEALRTFRPVDNLGLVTGAVMEFLLGVETEFGKLVQQVDEKLAAKAKEFADNVGPVVDLIGKGVEAIGALRETSTQLNGSQVEGVLDQVAWILQVMAGQVAKWADRISVDITESAKIFAENVGPVVDLIGGALEVIGALPKSSTKLNGSQVEGVLDQVAWILQVMAGQVAKWADRISVDITESAKIFAENVGPVVDLIGGALEVIGALPKSSTKLNGSQVEGVLDQVAWILQVMAIQVAKWADRISLEIVESAKTFAENAGPVVELIGGALEVIGALPKSSTKLSGPQVLGVLDQVAWILQVMTIQVAKWADRISLEIVESAKTFAENAGPVVELIGGALETLNGLQDYQSLSGLNAKILNIAYWINEMVRVVEWFAARMAVEIQESAKTFAENAGPVVELIGGALETLNGLQDYQSLSGLNAKILSIAYWINEMVRVVEWFAARMAVEIQESAKTFAENAGPVVELIGGALETLNGLQDYQSLSGLNAKILNIAYWINEMVREVDWFAARMAVEIQESAKTFAENAGPVIGIIKGAVEAITVLGGAIKIPTDLVTKLQDLSAFIGTLITWVGAVALKVKDQLQTEAKTFAENAGPVIGIIKGAVEAITVLGGAIKIPTDLVTKLQDLSAFIGTLITWVGAVALKVKDQLQTEAKTFAENAGPVIGIIKGAVEAITVLGGAIKIPTDLVTKLQDLSAFIGSLITWVGAVALKVKDQLQTEAKTFAENAGPVIGIIKGAVEAITVLGGAIKIPTDLVTKLQDLSAFIGTLITWVGAVALKVKDQLQTEAKTFADNAGPVLGIITSGVEAMKAMEGALVLPDKLVTKLQDLSSFIGQVITWMGTVGTQVTEELQTKAKTFAANAEPVFALTKSALELITVLEETKKPNLALLENIMKGIGGAIALIVTRTSSLSKSAVGELLPAVQTFNTNVSDTLTSIQGTLATLKAIGEEEAPAVGLAWVTELHKAMSAAVPSLTGVLNQIVTAFRTAETGIQANAFATGAGFMSKLTAGVGSGMAALLGMLNQVVAAVQSAAMAIAAAMNSAAANAQAAASAASKAAAAAAASAAAATGAASTAAKAASTAASQAATAATQAANATAALVQAVADQLPHSPAKKGPLSKPPDWVNYLTWGLDGAAASVNQLFSGMQLAPAGVSVSAVGAASGSMVSPVRGGGGPTVINFVYSPTVSMASQREAQEVIAPMLAEVLRREARRG